MHRDRTVIGACCPWLGVSGTDEVNVVVFRKVSYIGMQKAPPAWGTPSKGGYGLTTAICKAMPDRQGALFFRRLPNLTACTF